MALCHFPEDVVILHLQGNLLCIVFRFEKYIFTFHYFQQQAYFFYLFSDVLGISLVTLVLAGDPLDFGYIISNHSVNDFL